VSWAVAARIQGFGRLGFAPCLCLGGGGGWRRNPAYRWSGYSLSWFLRTGRTVKRVVSWGREDKENFGLEGGARRKLILEIVAFCFGFEMSAEHVCCPPTRVMEWRGVGVSVSWVDRPRMCCSKLELALRHWLSDCQWDYVHCDAIEWMIYYKDSWELGTGSCRSREL
jgi:hypothetical protein